jgi:uncharacterized membrane protein HdeD (DUF308 family)
MGSRARRFMALSAVLLVAAGATALYSAFTADAIRPAVWWVLALIAGGLFLQLAALAARDGQDRK